MVIIARSIPVLALVTYLVGGIFSAMGHQPEQVELERTYYILLMVGAVVTLAKICVSSYFAGIGRSQIVMICDVCGLIVNVPLCYAMVFGKYGFPEMCLAGAPVSTIIATLFASVLFFVFYFKKELRVSYPVLYSFAMDCVILRPVTRLGFPSELVLFLYFCASNLFTSMS